MKTIIYKKQFMIIFALFMGAMMFAAGTVWMQASASGLEAAAGAQTAVGTAFTYQGRLDKNGGGVTDACAFQFSLYDAASGGLQVGSTVAKSSISVSDGLFTTELDFGGGAFDGAARYLQIAVKCTGESSYTTLNGRVALNPAPYALGLRPGALIQGSLTGKDVLTTINTDTGYDSVAVYGRAGADMNMTNSSSIGVRGDSATGTGVAGYTRSSTGVSGYASNSSGTNFGVLGSTNSPDGYGVYSQGNAHVEGQLTWKPITSYVSLPAAAFNPAANGYTFSNVGNTLTPGDVSSFSYLAPAQLPQGATVTKVTFHWADGSIDDNGYATLYQIDLTGGETTMADVLTSGSSGTASSSSVTSIVNASIDNSQYAYYVWLYLPINNGTVSAYGAVIEYTIDRPY